MKQYLGTKEIAAKVRDDLKAALPLYKFSVTHQSFSGGSSIDLALMQGPEEVLPLGDGYAQLNHYYLDTTKDLTPKGLEVMEEATKILARYHWDDSDAQIDYFCCNFYMHVSIGKWDRPYEVKGPKVAPSQLPQGRGK